MGSEMQRVTSTAPAGTRGAVTFAVALRLWQYGTLTGRPERITLADLRTGLQRHCLLEANASWDRASVALAHVEKYFGDTARAIDVTRDAVSGYQESRILAGAAHNTVRY
jgi:hypothetical protein